MKKFFTSDHHFGHTNILTYEDKDRRDAEGSRFRSVNDMDTYLVDQWNSVVTQDDTVYHLGDLSYKIESVKQILPFLNGKIVLIAGNHDPFFKQMYGNRDDQEKAREQAREIGFLDVHTSLTLTIPGIGLVQLSHFPYHPPADEPEQDQRYLHLRPKRIGEAALLHGHIHSQWLYKQNAGMPPMINLGVEMWGMRPASEEMLVSVFQNKGIIK